MLLGFDNKTSDFNNLYMGFSEKIKTVSAILFIPTGIFLFLWMGQHHWEEYLAQDRLLVVEGKVNIKSETSENYYTSGLRTDSLRRITNSILGKEYVYEVSYSDTNHMIRQDRIVTTAQAQVGDTLKIKYDPQMKVTSRALNTGFDSTLFKELIFYLVVGLGLYWSATHLRRLIARKPD